MKNSDLLWQHLSTDPDDLQGKLALVDALTEEEDYELAETVKWAVDNRKWPSNADCLTWSTRVYTWTNWVDGNYEMPWGLDKDVLKRLLFLPTPDSDREALLQLRDALKSLNLIGEPSACS